MMPLPEDVASFLGRGGDETVLSLAGENLAIVTAMARSYTRDRGFDELGEPFDDVAAVLVTATARLMGNPDQLAKTTGPFSVNGGFTGWNLAETFVLNRYRVRAS